jgi:hypothetical protein
MSAPLWRPAFSLAVRDRRLTPAEKCGLLVLWDGPLSALDYRPMKAEAFGHLLGCSRQNAARILRRLVELEYVLRYQSGPREPRLYLLRNVMTDRAEERPPV